MQHLAAADVAKAGRHCARSRVCHWVRTAGVDPDVAAGIQPEFQVPAPAQYLIEG
jgi:hypothetical protein